MADGIGPPKTGSTVVSIAWVFAGEVASAFTPASTVTAKTAIAGIQKYGFPNTKSLMFTLPPSFAEEINPLFPVHQRPSRARTLPTRLRAY